MSLSFHGPMVSLKPILIVHQGALGDLMMSLPALYCLRSFHGTTPWTMAGNPETLSLLHRRFYAQEVVSIHQKEWALLFQEKSRLPDRFRHYLSSFQKAVLFSKSKPHILIRRLTRAGLEKVVWLPSFPDVPRNIPLQSLQKEILKSENIPWVEAEKIIFPSPEDLRAAREFLGQVRKIKGEPPLWAIQPGSGSPHKNWPPERFLEAARELMGAQKVQPLFLIGPVEEDLSPGMIETIEARGFPILRHITLPVLAGVLSYCAGYIGNDSGISHLAAALGLPSVVLFGPTDPALWSPRGKEVRVISASLPCTPCAPEAMRSCAEKKCLTSVTVSQVLEAINCSQG